MSNPSGPDRPGEPADQSGEEVGAQAAPGGEQQVDPDPEDHPTEQVPTPSSQHEPATEVLGSAAPEVEHEPATEVISPADLGAEHEPATEVISPADPASETATGEEQPRRFTAPSGFDAGSTQKIDPPSDPETEVFATPGAPPPKAAAPQVIPPRGEAPRPPHQANRSWGWVAAVLLVIAALVAVAVLGTVLLTRGSDSRATQEDMVRSTIEQFDVAIQNGDLATLRSITCGSTRDNYVRYDESAWAETHERVAAAKQYPVVASIDQVVINGDHAEANVTSFMAYAPQTRSTRSFDLEFRDDQWKICQAPQ